MSASSAHNEPEASTFEDHQKRLAEIVAELERGDLPLETSLALFEEGVKLARLAHAKIENAERRVEELLGFDTKGDAITRDITPKDGGAADRTSKADAP